MDQSTHPAPSFPDGGALNDTLLLLAPIQHLGSQESPQARPPFLDAGGRGKDRIRARGRGAQVLSLTALVVGPQHDGHEMRAGVGFEACTEIDPP